jgi:septin family protein
MRTTRQTLTSRRASESSPSPLVRITNQTSSILSTRPDFVAELELDEEGTRISLTIVDTPGFGDLIDNEAR